jgi:hypothetical protein
MQWRLRNLYVWTIPASTFLHHDELGCRVGIVVVSDSTIAYLTVAAFEEDECGDQGDDSADEEAAIWRAQVSSPLSKYYKLRYAYAAMAMPATAPLLRLLPPWSEDFEEIEDELG